MRLKKLIFFASAFCFVLSIGCVSGQKESTVLSDQGKAISESEKLEDYINSLDIHMELKDSVFTGRVDMIEYDIINNSEYELRTGSIYGIKQLESGYWKEVPPHSIIWTDIEIIVPPQSIRSFDESVSYLNLKPGRYRIEKEYDIHVPSIKRTANSYHITLSDEFVIL